MKINLENVDKELQEKSPGLKQEVKKKTETDTVCDEGMEAKVKQEIEQQQQELPEWEKLSRKINELELFLIRLTGNKENVYKTKLLFITVSGFVAGKVIQIGNRYLLIDENIKGKSRKVIVDTNQVIDIKIE